MSGKDHLAFCVEHACPVSVLDKQCWTGPPDAEEPASVVEVVSGASEGHGHASEAGSHERGSGSVGDHSRSEGGATVLADTGGIISPVYVGFSVVALTLMALLAMALVALLRKV